MNAKPKYRVEVLSSHKNPNYRYLSTSSRTKYPMIERKNHTFFNNKAEAEAFAKENKGFLGTLSKTGKSYR